MHNCTPGQLGSSEGITSISARLASARGKDLKTIDSFTPDQPFYIVPGLQNPVGVGQPFLAAAAFLGGSALVVAMLLCGAALQAAMTAFKPAFRH
jgi:hypothetical protein